MFTTTCKTLFVAQSLPSDGLAASTGRYQRGHVFAQHGAFHITYYATDIVDGQPKRVQRFERFRTKDNKRHSTKCEPVQQLAAQVMERVNAMSGTLPDAGLKAADFREQTYLPHLDAEHEGEHVARIPESQFRLRVKKV